jgi:hypothetical protein
MELTPYITALRQQLAMAAEAGGEDARALAERLTAPLESAVRLALLDTLSAAADEITRDLAPGSVELRIRGREPSFVVTPPPAEVAYEAPEAVAPPVAPDGDEGATARINFRLGEHLKSRIEDAAGQAGLSVNAWLVRAAATALDPDDGNRRSDRRGSDKRASWPGGQRYTGWVR